MPRNGRKRLLLLLLRVSFAGSQLGKAEYLCHLAPVILRLVRSSFLFVAFVCAASWMATHDLPLRKTCFVFSAFFFSRKALSRANSQDPGDIGEGPGQKPLPSEQWVKW